MTTTVTLDKRDLVRIIGQADNKAKGIVRKLALDYVGHVVNSFSSLSPSPVGEPPGVDTGALKNSITAEPATADGKTWDAYTDKDYAPPLEYGTVRMGARPFFRPAVYWIQQNVPDGVMLEMVR